MNRLAQGVLLLLVAACPLAPAVGATPLPQSTGALGPVAQPPRTCAGDLGALERGIGPLLAAQQQLFAADAAVAKALAAPGEVRAAPFDRMMAAAAGLRTAVSSLGPLGASLERSCSAASPDPHLAERIGRLAGATEEARRKLAEWDCQACRFAPDGRGSVSSNQGPKKVPGCQSTTSSLPACNACCAKTADLQLRLQCLAKCAFIFGGGHDAAEEAKKSAEEAKKLYKKLLKLLAEAQERQSSSAGRLTR